MATYRIRIACSLLGVAAFLPSSVHACTCAQSQFGNTPPKTMREYAASIKTDPNEVVFEGRVDKQELVDGSVGPPAGAMSMTTGESYRLVSLSVDRDYQGAGHDKVTLITGIGGGDCGFDFRMGEKYLVYARPDESGKSLFTSICSNTDTIDRAAPILRFLNHEPATSDDLLTPEAYQEQYRRLHTGSVCGRVTKPDGTPLAHAIVTMREPRADGFPAGEFSDENTSAEDGNFCIRFIDPGKYLLTAETVDFRTNSRWAGYFPGTTNHSDAKPLEIAARAELKDISFGVQLQQVYTVRFQIKTSDGSSVPSSLGIIVEQIPDDAISYHEAHILRRDGSYTFGLLPPGRYTIRTVAIPDDDSGKIPTDVARFGMARIETDVRGEGTVVVTISPTPPKQ